MRNNAEAAARRNSTWARKREAEGFHKGPTAHGQDLSPVRRMEIDRVLDEILDEIRNARGDK